MTWRAFWQLFAFEARQKAATLLLGVGVVLLLDAFIAWRVQEPQLQTLVAALVAAAPLLYWVFGGLAAFWGEFGSGAYLLIRGLPVSGAAVVAAKYLWLLTELGVLAGLLLASALYFADGVVPLSEIQLTPRLAWQLAALGVGALLSPPAIAVTASVVGRASRAGLLGGFAAFALLWWAYVLLGEAAGAYDALGQLTLRFAALPEELCAAGGQCYLRLNGALLLLQPLFALFALWIAGRAFDTLER